MTSIIIKNNKHFYKLTKRFDKQNNTRTYSAELTLRQIWDMYYSQNPMNNKWHAKTVEQYIHTVINQKVLQTFYQNNVNQISLDDPRITEGYVAKLNTAYMIKKEILSGGGITDPVSVSKFPNNTNPVHPGGSRLLLTNCYNEKIPVIITDYRNDNIDSSWMKTIDKLSYDFTNKFNIFMYENTKQTSGATYSQAGTGLDIMFKQVQSHSEKAAVFMHPQRANIERTFFLKDDNKIYINNLLLAEKHNKRWAITMKEEYI